MKHSDYLKKKKTRETRKKIISVISAIVVFITTYALVLPAITLDVSKASQEPGIAYEQMQFKATAAAASVTAADSTVEEAQVEEPAAEEPEEEPAEVIEEEPAETPEEEASAVSAEEEEEEEPVEEAPAEPEQEEAPAQEAPEVQEDKGQADSADEKSSESAPSEAEAADTQKAAEDAAVDQTGTDAAEAATAATEEAAPEFKVPELDALDFDEILTGKTNFYYYHVEDAEEAEEISSDSIDDWKKVNSDTVLAPEDFVRVYLSYEIPAGALNETNAVARYTLPAGLELSDKQIKAINKYENGIAASKSGSEKDKYLGAEAIEGSRTPDEKVDDEYIAATVKVKKTDNDKQELVFTFIPYTVEKNQISYDEKGEVKSKGKEVRGFFTFDLKTSQIGFEKTNIETVDKEDGTAEEIQYSEAKFVFADEDSNWIERALTLAAPVEKEEAREPKTLTSEGPDYTVTVSYTDEAQIPDNAKLEVSEIGKDTPEYESYLEQAKGAVGDETKSVNEARFFDITILVDGEKVEPKAPVSVQINFAGIEQTNTDDTQLLHYKDSEDVEVMDKAEFSKSEEQAVDTVQFETERFSVYGIVGTETLTEHVITANGESFTIEVTYGPEAEIPSGARLEAREILEGTEEYQKYLEQAKETVTKTSASDVDESSVDYEGDDPKKADDSEGSVDPDEPITAARFFDINIYVGDEKVEPKAPVQVNIKYDDAIQLEENELLKAIHFASDGTDLMAVDAVESQDGITEVTFTQNSFSVTGTVVQYLSSGWPSSDGDYVFIVKPYNSNNYYAVKSDGELTVVNYNGNTGKVTFPDLISTSQVDDYMWTISNHGSGWKYVTNDGNYLNPNYDTAITTDRDSINRNGNGLVYNYTTGYGYTYNYLTVDENDLKLEGRGDTSSDNRAVVFLANDFSVDEVPEPGEDPSGVDLGAPTTGKVMTPNNDGTYQLALSVTGKSQANSTDNKADVIVVLDLSSSMYDGNNGSQTRLTDAKNALYQLGKSLTDNNTEDHPDKVRLSLVTFNNTASTPLTGTFTYSDFETAVRGLSTTSNGNGTNWEAGLSTANSLSTRDGAAVYVIFVSDGNPTFRNTRGNYSNLDYNQNYYNTYGIYGTGSESNDTTVTRCYAHSRDDANTIVSAGKTFYTLGVYGNVDRMKYLTAYAYSGSDSGSYDPKYYQTASDVEAFKRALGSIVDDIQRNFSYTDVEIDDGITALTATALVTGTVNNYEYRITYVDAVDNQTHTVNATKNADGTLTIPSVTYNIKNTDGSTKSVTTAAVTVKGASYDGEKVTWELDKSDGTNYKLENGWTYEVSFTVWPTQRAYDLIADLANGNVTYASLSDEEKASIDQATLTLKTNSEASVTYRQITTTNGVDGTPSDPKTVGIDNPPGVPLAGSDLKIVKRWNDDLDPTQLLDLLTDHLNAAGTDVDYTVTLDVVQDKGTSAEEHVHTADYPDGFVYKPNVTIGTDSQGNPAVTAATWPEIDIAVAPGIMMTYEHAHAHGFDTAVDSEGNPKYRTIEFEGVTYYIIEEGHRYEITERAVDYHFEMMTDIDHLMIIDGVLKNVVHNDDGSIKEISQNPGNLTELGATNSLKGGINLYKYVEDSDGNKINPKDDVFTVKCKLVDDEGKPYTRSSETVGDDESDGIVYRVYAPDSELETVYPGKVETGRNRTIKIGVLNSSEFTVQLKAGWQIRFINVPSNTHWEFEEINIPAGYKLDTTGTEQVDGHTVPKTRGMTGIAMTNTANDAQITNTMEDFETRILKIETGTGTKDSETGEYVTQPVKLEGVKFIVKNNNDGDDNGKYLVLDGDNISWDSNKANATVFTTNSEGILSFGSLPLGKYLLTETETKPGYNLLTEDVNIEVTADGVTYRVNSTAQPVKANKETVTEGGKTIIYSLIEVPNSAGVVLPNTGGSGTLPYTLGGIALIMASALMYGFRMRRRERRLN